MKKWDSITTPPLTPTHPIIKTKGDFLGHSEISDLAELIKGKRVALVCPSPTLIGSNDGELIDSYDVVIRVNQKFEMSDKLKLDYGSKGDILIGSFNINNVNECMRNLPYLRTYKRLICVMPSSAKIGGMPTINFFNELTKLDIKNTRLDDRYIYKEFYNVGTVPNSGLMAILMLMNYDFKELYITGLTFYNMGKFGDVYNDEYKKSVGRVADQNSHDHKIHKQPPQIKYLQELHKNNPELIKLDEYLTENLHK